MGFVDGDGSASERSVQFEDEITGARAGAEGPKLPNKGPLQSFRSARSLGRRAVQQITPCHLHRRTARMPTRLASMSGQRQQRISAVQRMISRFTQFDL